MRGEAANTEGQTLARATNCSTEGWRQQHEAQLHRRGRVQSDANLGRVKVRLLRASYCLSRHALLVSPPAKLLLQGVRPNSFDGTTDHFIGACQRGRFSKSPAPPLLISA